jgi:hypothetical protein
MSQRLCWVQVISPYLYARLFLYWSP